MRVLAIGAHPDDVELGCGGTLLAHARAGDEITVLVVTDGARGGASSLRRLEQEVVTRRLAARLAWGGFEDGEVPIGRDLIGVIDAAVSASGASLVYTHAPADAHQDHRAVADATLAAARHLPTVLGYETPSTLTFQPTVFSPIDGLVDAKAELVAAHRSQIERAGRVDMDAIRALARVRGHQARTTAAEGFEPVRVVVAPGPSTVPMHAANAAPAFEVIR